MIVPHKGQRPMNKTILKWWKCKLCLYCLLFLVPGFILRDFREVHVSCIVNNCVPFVTPNWPSYVGPQSLCNRSFLWRLCVVTLLFGFFCGCWGFCHRTESDLFLFLFGSVSHRRQTLSCIICNRRRGRLFNIGIISLLFSRCPWISVVVLYCLCNSCSLSVGLYSACIYYKIVIK